MSKLLFKEGQHVRLKPDAEEGFPEEFGRLQCDVHEGDDMAMVELDEEFANDDGDDRLREVTIDQLEAV